MLTISDKHVSLQHQLDNNLKHRIMKTEESYQVQMFNFPTGLINAVNGKEGWEIVNTNPQDNHHMSQCHLNYEVRFNGKLVLRFQRMYGFGFGSSAVYPWMRMSVIKLLRTVYAVNIWDHTKGENVFYENEYSEN